MKENEATGAPVRTMTATRNPRTDPREGDRLFCKGKTWLVRMRRSGLVGYTLEESQHTFCATVEQWCDYMRLAEILTHGEGRRDAA